ncbi:hypothetical protein Tco_0049351 [Tanacetum coccineum]
MIASAWSLSFYRGSKDLGCVCCEHELSPRGEVIGVMGSGEGYGIAVECTRDSGLELETVGKAGMVLAPRGVRIGPSKSSQSLSIAHKWAVEID